MKDLKRTIKRAFWQTSPRHRFAMSFLRRAAAFTFTVKICLFLSSLVSMSASLANDMEISPYWAIASDPTTGAELFQANWTITKSEQHIDSIHIRYTDPAGKNIGYKHLDFSRLASQPNVDASAFQGKCTAKFNYVHARQKIETKNNAERKQQRKWKNLGGHVILDTAIIPTLIAHREEILANDYKLIEFASMYDSAPKRLHLRARIYHMGMREIIHIEASTRVLWMWNNSLIKMNVTRDDGQPLNYVGPAPLRCHPHWPARVAWKFVH